MFTDTQIIDERFLEDINNILNAGEVPNLFAADEMSQIDDAITPVLKEANLPMTPDSIWNTFVQRVKDNLHLVLCFSPVGDAFRRRCRMFPSLINCCTIDWFSKWPKEALLSVSQRYLKELEVPQEQTKNDLAEMCVEVHSSVQHFSERYDKKLKKQISIKLNLLQIV